MKLLLPDVLEVIERLLPMESSMDSRTQTIARWVKDHRAEMRQNLDKIAKPSDQNDLQTLRIFLRDLLMRSINAEAGGRIWDTLPHIIRRKSDLTAANFRQVLAEARYRWADQGVLVMQHVTDYFGKELDWDWSLYLRMAEQEERTNFPNDPLLKVKNIGFKVRDLALSNFNPNYAAFDLHVTRVVSRLGLVAYGWELTRDAAIDFGTNPSDESNYLFLHSLFIRLGRSTGGRFSLVDLDRIFWHLGRCVCGANAECPRCPVRDICLTGQQRSG